MAFRLTRLTESGPRSEAELSTVLRALLTGMKRHLVVVDPEDAERCRSELTALEERLCDPTQAGAAANAWLQILEQYSRAANKALSGQRSEFLELVSDLTVAMSSLGDIYAQSEARLKAIESQLGPAATASDLAATKSRLLQHVSKVKAEMLDQRSKLNDLISGAVARMQAGGDRVRRLTSDAPAPLAIPDALTGLPGRALAEAHIAKMHAEEPERHLAAFALERLGVLTSKFGFAAADELVFYFAQHLAESAPEPWILFRWAAACFVILNPAPGGEEEFQRRIKSMQLHRITRMLDLGARSALVPLLFESAITCFREHDSPVAVARWIDRFSEGA